MSSIKDYETAAKITLSDGERDFITVRMQALMESFDKLRHIDTEGVAPLVTVLDVRNVFRDDAAVNGFSRDELLDYARGHYEGCYTVPKTLD